jgi:hypothetical protein
MRQGWLTARLAAAIGTAALFAGAANAQSVQDFEKAMSGGWAVAAGPASGGKACRLDLDPAPLADGHAVKADDCGGALAAATRWAIAGKQLALYGAGNTLIVALGGNQTHLGGKTAKGEAVELVRPAAAAAVRKPAPPTVAQLVVAFAGPWRAEEAAAGKANRCAVDLKADAADQHLAVTHAGCRGDLAGATAWAIAGSKLALRDAKGHDVVLLGGNQFRLMGKSADGHEIVLARTALPRAPGLGGRGCAYLGYSTTCASTIDLLPPAMSHAGTAPLGLLVTAPPIPPRHSSPSRTSSQNSPASPPAASCRRTTPRPTPSPPSGPRETRRAPFRRRRSGSPCR